MLKNNSTFAALVGDSVFAPHFFSWAGVNSGILEADKIVELMDSELSCQKMVGDYNRFCKRERRSRWSGYSGLAIPFAAIKDSIKSMTGSALVQAARSKGFGPSITRMDKTSLGYLVGCDAIPGCTNPEDSPGVESFLTCFQNGCPEYKVRNPRTRRCIKVDGEVYEKVCTSPPKPVYSPKRRVRCTRDGCPGGKVRNPRTRRCIKVGGKVYEEVCS